jgi:carbon monoxide dehydrogenase subunit G
VKLENRATVAADPDVVFEMLNNPQQIVGCIPGGALTGRDGDAWAGGVTVKVGPITAAYSGTVRFLDVDSSTRSMRLVARGADTRGSGDAEAEVAIQVEPAAEGSRLLIDTDLLIRGKLAQFGKGAIATVSSKILNQFATELGRLAANGGAGPEASTDMPAGAQQGSPTRTAASARPLPSAAPAPASAPELNAFSLVIGPLLKAYGRPAALLTLGLVHGWVMGRAITIERFYRSTRR